MQTLLGSIVENPIPTDANNRRITQLIPMYRQVATAYREGRADPPAEASASPLPEMSRRLPPPAPPSHYPQAGGRASASAAPPARKNPATTTNTKTPEEMTPTEWKAWRGRVIVSFEAWANLLEEALECARRNDRVGYRDIITERMWKVKVNGGD
jgi:hypothetical protein